MHASRKRSTYSFTTFRNLDIAAPVPSKRIRHRRESATLVTPTLHKTLDNTAQPSSKREAPVPARAPPRLTLSTSTGAVSVSLLLDPPLSDHAALSEKQQEKEYLRRQRRIFVRSRYMQE